METSEAESGIDVRCSSLAFATTLLRDLCPRCLVRSDLGVQGVQPGARKEDQGGVTGFERKAGHIPGDGGEVWAMSTQPAMTCHLRGYIREHCTLLRREVDSATSRPLR